MIQVKMRIPNLIFYVTMEVGHCEGRAHYGKTL